ncbi:unnamed protein product [Auanema sp. JU1783]|nr:unnamed protein product [Auanema sp. JU1783]
MSIFWSILISVRSEQLNVAPADPAQVSSRSSKRKSSEFKKLVDRKYSSGSRRSLDAISVSSLDLLGTSGGCVVFAYFMTFDSIDLHDVSLPHVNETRNIYYEDELAKKEKEIQEMRNSLHKFEYRIRELEQSSLCKDLANHELQEKFKEQIRVLEGRLKLISDGGELEYLRNIFVQYLSCNNNSGAKHILKAIGMVLKLSPTEMKAIDKKIF